MYVYVCMYVYIYVCMYVNMYVCMYVYMYVRMYVCVCICVCQFPITALREAKILQTLQHENIIGLLGIVNAPDDPEFSTVFMVFEYMENDLIGLLKNPVVTLSPVCMYVLMCVIYVMYVCVYACMYVCVYVCMLYVCMY